MRLTAAIIKINLVVAFTVRIAFRFLGISGLEFLGLDLRTPPIIASCLAANDVRDVVVAQSKREYTILSC